MNDTNIGEPPVLDGTLNGMGVIETTVDGEPAKVDTRPEPKQPTLVEVPLEQLVHDFTVLFEERDDVIAEKKRAGKQFNAQIESLTARINPIVAEMRRRDEETAGSVQTSMFGAIHAAIDGFDPQEDDVPEEDEDGGE